MWLLVVAMWVTTFLAHFSLVARLAVAVPPSDLGEFCPVDRTENQLSAAFECPLQHIPRDPFDFWKEVGQFGDKVVHHATELFDSATAAFASAPDKFAVEWKEAGALGDKVVHHATELFDSAAEAVASADIVNEFKAAVENVMAAIKEFENQVRREGIDSEELNKKLTAEIIIISEQLQAEFSELLPEGKTTRQKQRKIIIESALSKLEDAVVAITGLWGVSEVDARAHFEEIKPHIKTFLVISVKMLDEHPVLTSVVLTAVTRLLPKGWLFRAILNLFGFGLKGPVKGSAAAWAQRTFWGDAVKAESWFSKMQAAAMVI